MAPLPLWDLLVFLASSPPGWALLGYLSTAVADDLVKRAGPPRLPLH